jgi:hypothetical protein
MKTKHTTYTVDSEELTNLPVWVSTTTLGDKKFIYTFISNE